MKGFRGIALHLLANMVTIQRLAPSLAAGLFTAGLGLSAVATPGVAEAAGIGPIGSSPATPPMETAGLRQKACSLFFWALPGNWESENYSFCLSKAPGTERPLPLVASVLRA